MLEEFVVTLRAKIDGIPPMIRRQVRTLRLLRCVTLFVLFSILPQGIYASDLLWASMSEPLNRIVVTGKAPQSQSGPRLISGARANALALQSDGKIVVAGAAWSGLPQAGAFALARYLPNGNVDLRFGVKGKVVTKIGDHSAEAFTLALQPDGKIVVAGTLNDKFVIVRYQANGALDPHFGSGGKMITSIGRNGGAATLTLQPNGKILVVEITDRNIVLIRYQADGHLDTYFGMVAVR